MKKVLQSCLALLIAVGLLLPMSAAGAGSLTVSHVSGRQGETAVVEVFCAMSLLLRYKSVLMAVTSVAGEMGAKVQAERIAELSVMPQQSAGMPIPYKLEPIGNVSQGLASAVLPGILVLILQQSIILAICFLGASSRERALRNGGKDPLLVDAGALSSVIGRALCYFTIMIVPSIFVLHFVPIIFSFPMNGSVCILLQ